MAKRFLEVVVVGMVVGMFAAWCGAPLLVQVAAIMVAQLGYAHFTT